MPNTHRTPSSTVKLAPDEYTPVVGERMEAPAARCKVHDAPMKLKLDGKVDRAIVRARIVFPLAQRKPIVVRFTAEASRYISHCQ